MTTSGKRCRCRAGDDGLCAPHRDHGDKKQAPPTLSAEERAAIDAEFLREVAETCYAKFCRSYYDILRELYNVSEEGMEDEYIQYLTIGRTAFNALHSKTYTGFCSRIQ